MIDLFHIWPGFNFSMKHIKVHLCFYLKNMHPDARSTSDKTSLASYIRLFEPMVIKALKHYTVSCHMLTQVKEMYCYYSCMLVGFSTGLGSQQIF